MGVGMDLELYFRQRYRRQSGQVQDPLLETVRGPGRAARATFSWSEETDAEGVLGSWPVSFFRPALTDAENPLCELGSGLRKKTGEEGGHGGAGNETCES